MSTDEETDMIRETVAKFVDRELIPLEPHYLKSRLPGSDHPELSVEQKQRLRTVSKDLGLWGLDAPEDLGGHDLPTRTMAAVNEELGQTCVPFVLPPDSPNLHMLQAVGTEAQKRKYMQPYIAGRMVSAIAISEPGAGGDPAGMKTRAVKDGDHWVINGRKIWISAHAADFIIVMARVGSDARRAASPPSWSTRARPASSWSARSRCSPAAHLRGRVRGLPCPGRLRARRHRQGLRADAAPPGTRRLRWDRGASAWRSARSTCCSSTPTSA